MSNGVDYDICVRDMMTLMVRIMMVMIMLSELNDSYL